MSQMGGKRLRYPPVQLCFTKSPIRDFHDHGATTHTTRDAANAQVSVEVGDTLRHLRGFREFVDDEPLPCSPIGLQLRPRA